MIGTIRSLKIIEWLRETSGCYLYRECKRVPKLLLLGNWLSEAGFACNERVKVIPFKGLLIIVPDIPKV